MYPYVSFLGVLEKIFVCVCCTVLISVLLLMGATSAENIHYFVRKLLNAIYRFSSFHSFVYLFIRSISGIFREFRSRGQCISASVLVYTSARDYRTTREIRVRNAPITSDEL